MTIAQSKKFDRVISMLTPTVREWLQSEPHKIKFLADEGKTMLDFVEWHLDNGTPDKALIATEYAALWCN